MHNGGSDDGAITAINVTPFVDIILVVLIVFMATAPIIQRRAIKVDVPKAAHHERAAVEALQIAYNGKKELTLAGRKIGEDDLMKVLKSAVFSQPQVHVTLSADKALPYGEIVRLLDRVRGAGVRKVGLEVVHK